MFRYILSKERKRNIRNFRDIYSLLIRIFLNPSYTITFRSKEGRKKIKEVIKSPVFLRQHKKFSNSRTRNIEVKKKYQGVDKILFRGRGGIIRSGSIRFHVITLSSTCFLPALPFLTMNNGVSSDWTFLNRFSARLVPPFRAKPLPFRHYSCLPTPRLYLHRQLEHARGKWTFVLIRSLSCPTKGGGRGRGIYPALTMAAFFHSTRIIGTCFHRPYRVSLSLYLEFPLFFFFFFSSRPTRFNQAVRC